MGAGELARAGGNLEPTAREGPAQSEANQPWQKQSHGRCSARAPGCPVAAEARGAPPHAATRTRGGFGSARAGRGAGSAPRALLAERRPPGGAPGPSAAGGHRRPPRAGSGSAPGPRSAPSRVRALTLTRTRPSTPKHPGAQAAYAAPAGHQETDSRAAGQQVSRAQRPARGPDSDFSPGETSGPLLGPPAPPSAREAASPAPGRPRHPGAPAPLQGRRTLRPGRLRSPGAARGPPGALALTPFSPTSETGYLFHALQTTLWTVSLLFKSPPGEGEKKIQRRSESIEKKKKLFKRVSTAAKKVTY